ncbi:hypothetical protein MTAT_19050 [Moorella thermoacetica]|uniref:Uncharacterized protein n=1 Tax=Neomoorella thermoacetica TaxID=1525 RepID=A0AAC9HII4_NEOTH|nr:hypothetical protein Maut_02132 [Moorella thermoacetica]TYL12663.1 hypothetical protein MTAT_19050 [Moorella thermoacetica]
MCNLTNKQCANAGSEICRTCQYGSEFEFADYNDILCISFNDGGAGICNWVWERLEYDYDDLPSYICEECNHYRETLTKFLKQQEGQHVR